MRINTINSIEKEGKKEQNLVVVSRFTVYTIKLKAS